MFKSPYAGSGNSFWDMLIAALHGGQQMGNGTLPLHGRVPPTNPFPGSQPFPGTTPSQGTAPVDPGMGHIVNDPVFDAFYAQQQAAGKSLPEIMDAWEAQKPKPVPWAWNPQPYDPNKPLPANGYGPEPDLGPYANDWNYKGGLANGGSPFGAALMQHITGQQSKG